MTALFHRALRLVLPAAALLFSQGPSTFQAQTNLVLLPFNVARGNYFAPDVKPDDVVLLEDGKPRPFTIFEGPATPHRAPLDLVLLFDTTTLPPSKPGFIVATHWNREATYSFASHWDEAMSRAILEKNGADVRVSVYRFDRRQLQRLCQSTANPQVLLSAFHQLLAPMPGADGTIPLTLPPDRKALPELAILGSNGWLMESAIATLKDAAAATDKSIRMLGVFSEGFGGTMSRPEDVADQATALGIPVYPVVLDYEQYMRFPFSYKLAAPGEAGTIYRPGTSPANSSVPNAFPGLIPTMDRFAGLAGLTGGRSFSPSQIDADIVTQILDAIRDEGLSRYVVGFVPQPSSVPGKMHKLEVRLKSKSTGKLIGGKIETAW